MPRVAFDPVNQCTLDDPTDGAVSPSAVPTASSGAPPSSIFAEPGCRAGEPGAGGSSSECTDELVRRFGAEGAGSTLEEPKGGDACVAQIFTAIGSCVGVHLSGGVGELRSISSCASAVLSLIDCERGKD